MGLLQLLVHNPVEFAIVAVALLYSIIFHEMAHGWVALLFGDDTAKMAGRLTLNPISHIDPIGAAMLVIAGFGWAKPVPVSYSRLRGVRLGLISVALAGCAVNILIATAALSALRFQAVQTNETLYTVFAVLARINLMLGAFNLIPIPPLDGSRVLETFLPFEMKEMFSRIEPFGFFILVALLLTGILNPVISFMQSSIEAAISLGLGLFFH